MIKRLVTQFLYEKGMPISGHNSSSKNICNPSPDNNKNSFVDSPKTGEEIEIDAFFMAKFKIDI